RDAHAARVERGARGRVPRGGRGQGRGREPRVRHRHAEPRRPRQPGPPDGRRPHRGPRRRRRRGAWEPPVRASVSATDGRSPFPPIADYAFLSDCEVTALVAPSGNVEWMCLPRMDSPSVFGAILDRDGGSFRIGPAEMSVPAGRRYLPGTNVLETTWMTRMGWLVVHDALCMGPWHDEE